MNTTPKPYAFGSWQSPITADLIVSSAIGLSNVTLDQGNLYWLESRPSEGGRNVLVRQTPHGIIEDITPPPYNVRTRVHEYGGGAFLVNQGTIYFSNFKDQRIYQQTPGSAPQPLTPEGKKRYADSIIDASRNRLICVCEEHQPRGETKEHQEPVNTLSTVDLTTGEVKILVSGSDFYSSPRLSPDGSKLAWIEWNHPNMPWDGTELYLASIKPDGTLGEKKLITGGKEEAVCAPEWSPDEYLYFVSDRALWWNIYQYDLTSKEITPVYPNTAEFGYPHWVFGVKPYQFESAESLICSYTQNGQSCLGKLDVKTNQLQVFNLPFTNISSFAIEGNYIYFIGGSATIPTQLVKMELETLEETLETVTIKKATSLEIDEGYLSIPEAIEFPTEDGNTAYAWYYPPQNQDYCGLEGELPPLMVKSHGGPTASTTAAFNLKIQYWTSRGFAVVDVNYGGSTGYGREYRQRLNQQWGVVDVQDCASAAQYLVKQGKVDGNKLAIAGSSAGGYTTLAALTFLDVFKAGASYYGISDLEVLAQDTHKFESRYLDSLVGPYPEAKEIYRARSPIHFVEQLSCPVIFFQGLEDQVVPPNQAERMVNALKEKGIPVAYITFAEEQHGFRKAENIKRAIEAEFYFYSQVFGFQAAGAIETVEIMNLKPST